MTSKFPDKNKIDDIRVFLDIFPKEITKNIVEININLFIFITIHKI